MTKYEIMYIIRPDIDEESKKAVMERFHAILTDNGAEIENVKENGKRRLAYEINDYREGYYVIVNFSSDALAVNEFDRQAKFSEDLIRHMAVRVEE